MNKKKKTTQIKHRKNRMRMKKLIQASRLKAKPKKVSVPQEIEIGPPKTAKEVTKPVANKASTKKVIENKSIIKKAPAKKKPAKKASVKKTPNCGIDLVTPRVSLRTFSLD